MCGISGAITVRNDLPLEPVVRGFAQAQHARGPDALHVEASQLPGSCVVLGHNRLSIIDLAARSDQPMSNGAGDCDIVFNGEIYNYLEIRQELEALGVVFKTASDTEVLLEAYSKWGEAAFGRFLGMFAVGLVDRARGRLLLLRDRFGVKPLHYWTDGRTLIFGSQAAPLARWAGLSPDIGYLTRGLAYKYYEDETSQSPFTGLNCVEPGTYVVVTAAPDAGVRTASHRYFDLAEAVASEKAAIAGLDFPALEERLLFLLKNACDIRMRADVQVGVSLSGGVDSTAIAALVSEGRSNFVAYSFSRPDDLASEGPLVDAFSKAVGLQTRYVGGVQSPAAVEELFWATYKCQEAPFPHASIMAQHAVFRAARKDGVKVLLGGQAGDEAFMGYRKFFLFHLQSILRRRALLEGARFAFDALPFLVAVLRRAGVFWSERGRYFGKGEGMGTRLVLPPSMSASPRMDPDATPRDRQMLDVTRYSLPTLLRYEDRNSMGNSVESRLPFVDHRVVAFGLALPEWAKLSHGYGKWILRDAMRGRAPDSIMLNRDKRGFDVDQNGWIGDGLGGVLRSALHERKAKIGDFLPQGSEIDDLFSDAALRSDARAFREAVSLMWLGDWR